jgi:hypothetical protein
MPFLGLDPRGFGRNHDIDLKALTEFDFPTHVRIHIGAVAGIKSEAGACHASQGGMQMRRGLMGFVTRAMGRYESFMRAYPPVDGKAPVLPDLFAGLDRAAIGLKP